MTSGSVAQTFLAAARTTWTCDLRLAKGEPVLDWSRGATMIAFALRSVSQPTTRTAEVESPELAKRRRGREDQRRALRRPTFPFLLPLHDLTLSLRHFTFSHLLVRLPALTSQLHFCPSTLSNHHTRALSPHTHLLIYPSLTTTQCPLHPPPS